MEATVLQGIRFGSRRLPDLEQFCAEARREVLGLAERTDLRDDAAIDAYGLSTRTRTAGMVDEIASAVDASQDRRDALQRMLRRLFRHDPGRARRHGLLDLADIGVLFSPERRLLAHHERLQMTLERLAPRLDAGCNRLDRDLAEFDRLSDRIADQVLELDILIAAGTMAIDEAAGETLPRLRQAAGATRDPRTAESLRRDTERVERFEQHLRELHAARGLALQGAARIRSVREELVDLASAVRSILFDTVPRWKLQLLGEITLLRCRQTRRLRAEHVRETSPATRPDVPLAVVRTQDAPGDPAQNATLDPNGCAARRPRSSVLQSLRRRVSALLGLNVDLISSSFWND